MLFALSYFLVFVAGVLACAAALHLHARPLKLTAPRERRHKTYKALVRKRSALEAQIRELKNSLTAAGSR